MGQAAMMEWIVAQPTLLGSNPATNHQTTASISELVIILIILLIAQLVIGYLKLKRRYWVPIISAAVFIVALKMIIERFPS